MLAAKIYAHAKEAPERTAIVFDNRKVSYGRFAWLIERTRRYLATQNLASEGIAVLPTASILDTWVFSLALRSLGLTTMAVGSEDQVKELCLPEIRCVVVGARSPQAQLGRLCTAYGWRFVSIPSEIYEAREHADTPEWVEPNAPFGGHVLLTSGTTRDPKKYLIDPSSEPAMILHRKEFLRLSAQSIVNVFNYGVWTVGGYNLPSAVWDAGGAVVIHQGPDMWDSLRFRGITDTVATPLFLSEVLNAPPDALTRDDAMRLFVGGGPLSVAMFEAAKTRLTSCIYTHIASTEASSYALTAIERLDDLRWHRIFPTREVQVVDEHDRILPAGEMGEVRIRLLEGTAGYLHDEAATRAFFRDGYFYSGDLGVFRSDGRLALRGRVTEVINFLGNKIAVGPIEEALQQKLPVSAASVFSFQNEAAEEEVHVALETSQSLDQEQLAASLGSVLQGAGRIHVHVVDALPRNENGKIVRRRLLDSGTTGRGSSREFWFE